jgi:hypothetical protein
VKTRIVILGILGACVVIILSYSISVYYSEGAFEDWKPLGTPPYEVEEIVTVYFDAMSDATIASTTADNALFQVGGLSICSKASCWKQVESIPVTNDWSEMTITTLCRSDYRRIAPPPSTPVWCANYSDIGFGTHFVRDAHFVMLEDGDVWVWQFIPGQGALLIIITGIAVAGLIGVLMLLVLLWMNFKERRTIPVADAGKQK